MNEHPVTREHAIHCAQNVGRRLGYAVAVHGTQVKDLDLLAAPWTDEAETPLELVKCIASALPGVFGPANVKPHGRRAWVIQPLYCLGIDAWYIDISVMPRRGKRVRQ
jgi:hypothetical protein